MGSLKVIRSQRGRQKVGRLNRRLSTRISVYISENCAREGHIVATNTKQEVVYYLKVYCKLENRFSKYFSNILLTNQD